MNVELILLVAFAGMIAIHELGHYIAAIALGMKINQVFIGLPIKEVSFRIHDMGIYANSFLLGGGVDIKDFEKHAPWKKVIVAACGPLANILFCIVVFAVITGSVSSGISLTGGAASIYSIGTVSEAVQNIPPIKWELLSQIDWAKVWEYSIVKMLVSSVTEMGQSMPDIKLGFSTMALLGLWVGIFNLIPIPGTDGGHIVSGVIETIFPIARNKKVIRARVVATNAVLIILFTLTMLVYVKELYQITGWVGINVTVALSLFAWIVHTIRNKKSE